MCSNDDSFRHIKRIKNIKSWNALGEMIVKCSYLISHHGRQFILRGEKKILHNASQDLILQNCLNCIPAKSLLATLQLCPSANLPSALYWLHGRTCVEVQILSRSLHELNGLHVFWISPSICEMSPNICGEFLVMIFEEVVWWEGWRGGQSAWQCEGLWSASTHN